jgi:hypothetical protein
MPEPIFERVPAPGSNELPPELVGKSAAEVAAFYQNREKTIVDTARKAIATASAGNPQPPAPPAPVRTVVTTPTPEAPITRAELDSKLATSAKTLIATAQMLAAQGRSDWNKWFPQVNAIVGTLPEGDQVDPQIWITAYDSVRGKNVDSITADAVKAATTPVGAEPVAGAPITPTAPQPLGVTEKRVINGLGISEETYRQGAERIEQGAWPLTMNNKK